MNKHIPEYILIFFLTIFAFLCSNASAGGGISLFEKYSFEDGTFTVVGLIYHEKGNKIQDYLKDFYIEDIDVLNNLKKSWITDDSSPLYACGYHYEILILRNGQTKESFVINLDKGCNTVVTDYGQFYFDPTHMENLIGKVIQAKKEQKQFRTLKEAREFYHNLAKNKNLLFVHAPIWEKFEGDFRFWINCEKKFHAGISSEECLNNVTKEIQSNFPNELFSVKKSGSSFDPDGNKILMEVQSTKQLYDKFELYNIEWKWDEYKPILTVFWK